MVNLLKIRSVRLFLYIIGALIVLNLIVGSASASYSTFDTPVEQGVPFTPVCTDPSADFFYFYMFAPTDEGYIDESGATVPGYAEWMIACGSTVTLTQLGTYETEECDAGILHGACSLGTPGGGTVFEVIEAVVVVPFDFLGDTFTSTVVSSVTGGVQDTTQPLVPIAGAMVGVPLAFVIARRVIGLIRLMV